MPCPSAYCNNFFTHRSRLDAVSSHSFGTTPFNAEIKFLSNFNVSFTAVIDKMLTVRHPVSYLCVGHGVSLSYKKAAFWAALFFVIARLDRAIQFNVIPAKAGIRAGHPEFISGSGQIPKQVRNDNMDSRVKPENDIS